MKMRLNLNLNLKLNQKMHRFGEFTQKLIRDAKGMSAVLVTMSLIPTILVIGIATDVSRAYIVKTRLRAALDAAALAGGKSFFDNDREAQIKKYFDANFPAGFYGSSVSGPYELDEAGARLPSGHVYSENDSALRLTADVTVPTVFMSIVDYDYMEVGGDSEVMRETSLLDVVMAIDMSGSMLNSAGMGGGLSRLDTAKEAAKDLVKILFGNDEENALLNVGLVPWAGKVNVTKNGTKYGKDAFGNTIPQSQRYTTKTVPGSPANPYKEEFYRFDKNGNGNKWDEEDLVLKNWTPKINKVYYAHNAPSIPLLAEPEEGWKGCVYARFARTRAYERSRSYRDSTAESQAGDIHDGPFKIATGPAWVGWYPMGSEGEKSSCDLKKLNKMSHACTPCPEFGITPMQHKKSDLLSAITELDISSGNSYTNIPQGLAWAWRAISPGKPFDEATVVADPNYVKHKAIILLTDGENTMRSGDAYNYGFHTKDKRDQRLKDLADRIKNLDDADPENDDQVLIYTIQFANNSTELVDLLKYVATDKDHYFYAPDSGTLKAAFKKIAKDLSKLRLSK